MGRRKTIHVVLQPINRSGPERTVVCAVETPYHLMAVFQDGGGIEILGAEQRQRWFSTVKEVFSNIVLDNKTGTPPQDIAVQLHHACRHLWKKDDSLSAHHEEPPRVSIAVLEIHLEQVIRKTGHSVRYFMTGPDVALVLGNTAKLLHDEEASIMYRQLGNMYKVAVRVGGTDGIAKMINRYNEGVRHTNKGYTWWHKRENGDMGVTGVLQAVDEENTLAMISKDVLSLLADKESGERYGCDTVAKMLAALYENGGANDFLERIGRIPSMELTPREPGLLEAVICLPYMRNGLTL